MRQPFKNHLNAKRKMAMTRLEAFREKMSTDIDAALITDGLNIRYLSGVDYTDGFLLITRDSAYLFADSRYIEMAKNTASAEFKVMLLSGKRSALIKPLIDRDSALGYEDHSMTVATLTAYKDSLKGYRFKPLGRVTEMLRNVKDGDEKQFVIKAQRIAERALDEVLPLISTDMTEADLALELEYRMRKNGADGIAFDTIAVSGAHSSMPHGVPERRKIQKGFLTMDFGAKYNGYCSDMTRTVSVGKPTAEMVKIYSTVLKAQTEAIEMIKAGVRCADADKVARDIIDKAGYKGCFSHSLGHGVGLYIHEPISLSPLSEGVLEKGNVVTVEPGIYVEGRCGVRIEDMLYVTDGGSENLTLMKKDLIII